MSRCICQSECQSVPLGLNRMGPCPSVLMWCLTSPKLGLLLPLLKRKFSAFPFGFNDSGAKGHDRDPLSCDYGWRRGRVFFDTRLKLRYNLR
ncbi:hypothetical protein OUZ56_033291 [Daphnia magna]|uniref:Uncharacterized protein n=1 Tax=Daphnia magna TaxID=35525 RepID=A0ABR0BAJ2_9CRUS|nr:hypothetical protein OUZ56_033291 [Daphnia magna]